jgi:hypothetical protein
MPSVYMELERYPRWGGLDAVLECDFVNDLENMKWEDILEILQQKYERAPPDAFKERRRVVKDRLREAFQKDKPYRSLFNKNAIHDPSLTQQVMLDMTDMASGVAVTELTYSSLEPLMRALLHQTAKRLGLLTETEDSPTSDAVVGKRMHVRQERDGGTL